MKLILCLLLVSLKVNAGWRENALASVLVAEAGIDGKAGMECVAEVIVNRAAAKRVTPNSLLNPAVFSSIRGTTTDAMYARYRRDPRFGQALDIARTALHSPDKLPRRVHGATHFCQSRNKPWWASKLHLTAVVGGHSFYR